MLPTEPQPRSSHFSSSSSLHLNPFVWTPPPRAHCSVPRREQDTRTAPGHSSWERHPRQRAGCCCVKEGKAARCCEAVVLFPTPAHSPARIYSQELGFVRARRVNACAKRDRCRPGPVGPAHAAGLMTLTREPKPSHGATRSHAGGLGSGFPPERGREEIPAPAATAPCPSCPDTAGCERTSATASAPAPLPRLRAKLRPSLPPAQILTSSWKPHPKARTEPRCLSTPLLAPTVQDFSWAPCHAHKHFPGSINSAPQQVPQVQNSPPDTSAREIKARSVWVPRESDRGQHRAHSRARPGSFWALWGQAPPLQPKGPAARQSHCCKSL